MACRTRSRLPSVICRLCRQTRRPRWSTYAIGDTASIAGDTPHTTFRCTENGLATGIDDPDRTKFGSSHSGGIVQAVFLDGHVRGLKPDIALAVLKALSTIGGGEVVPDRESSQQVVSTAWSPRASRVAAITLARRGLRLCTGRFSDQSALQWAHANTQRTRPRTLQRHGRRCRQARHRGQHARVRHADYRLRREGGGQRRSRACGWRKYAWRVWQSVEIVRISTMHDWPEVSRADTERSSCRVHGIAVCRLGNQRRKILRNGLGPMRAAACREELFQRNWPLREIRRCVGVLEDEQTAARQRLHRHRREMWHRRTDRLTLLRRPHGEHAGTVQIVARSVETALHKLHELGFDLSSHVKGRLGIAPLPPVGDDDMAAIGRTNDAILYGGCVCT